MIDKIQSHGMSEEDLELTVFILWETGMCWEDIADEVYIPLCELLKRPAINDLYNK